MILRPSLNPRSHCLYRFSILTTCSRSPSPRYTLTKSGQQSLKDMAEIEDGVSFRWAHAGRICQFAGSWRGKLEKIGVQVVSFRYCFCCRFLTCLRSPCSPHSLTLSSISLQTISTPLSNIPQSLRRLSKRYRERVEGLRSQ